MRCTECGTVFRVMPARAGSRFALDSEPWLVTQSDRQQLQFASVSDLSRAILAGHLDGNDVLSRGVLPARRLGDVLELSSFFARALKPPPSDRTPTLPGLHDPVLREAIEHARAEFERLQRLAAEQAAAPPTDPTPTAPLAAEPSPPPPPALLDLTPAPSSVVFEPLPVAFASPEPAPLCDDHPEPHDSTPRSHVSSAFPEAAVSPPQLPPVDDPTDPALHEVFETPRRTRAERLHEARRARMKTGVAALLATATLVLAAGLGVKSLRQRSERLVVGPSSSAVATVGGTESGDTESVPVAAPASLPNPQPPQLGSAVPELAALPSATASAEHHRGDPAHLSPVDPRRMVADGAQALRHGDLGKADAAFRRALDKNPYDSEALSGMADLARVRGQLDRARELYAQALSVNPNYLPALLALADLAWTTGDMPEARKGYEHIVAHYPPSAYPARVKRRIVEEVVE